MRVFSHLRNGTPIYEASPAGHVGYLLLGAVTRLEERVQFLEERLAALESAQGAEQRPETDYEAGYNAALADEAESVRPGSDETRAGA